MTLVLNRTPVSKKKELDQAKAQVLRTVNTAIGEKRKDYITAIAGQEMIYLEKEREAKSYLAADPEPVDLTGFPFLAAEAGAAGYTPYQLAQIILFKAEQWRGVGPQLEALRVGTGVAIDLAESLEAVAEILADFQIAMAAAQAA